MSQLAKPHARIGENGKLSIVKSVMKVAGARNCLDRDQQEMLH